MILVYENSLSPRLSTFNSFGVNTYLGSSLSEPAPWIDMTKEINLSQLMTDPPDVVTLSRNPMGHITVTVKSTRATELKLYSSDRRLLATAPISVYSSQWTSVVKLIGQCVAGIYIDKTGVHPSAEGSFINVEMSVTTLRPGDKCHLFVGVIFSDGTRLLLEDVQAGNYTLEVNGIEVANGNLITYQPLVNVTLYNSLQCREPKMIFSGVVDLGRERRWDERDEQQRESSDKQPHASDASAIPITTPPTSTPAIPAAKTPIVDQGNSLAIAIYCVIGVIAMAVVIVLLNCLIGFNVRRQSIASIRRRLSKSAHNDQPMAATRKETHLASSQLNGQEHYPPLLPPPGPIMPPGKQQQQSIADWGVSSESGIGPERSSLGSQQDAAAVALSTFRVSVVASGGSTHPSDSSSSYIHQASPYNDVILESSGHYTTDQPSPTFDNGHHHGAPSQPFWSAIGSSPYRLLPDPGQHHQTDCHLPHCHLRSPDHRGSSDLQR